MSFAIGAANVPSLDGWLSPGLAPRAESKSYAQLQARQNSTAPTVNLFIDSTDSDFEYAASIVEACADHTVYALQCTAGGEFGDSATCGPNGVIATVTEGASTYTFSDAITTATLGSQVTVTALENCVLGGTTAATCTATAKLTVDGTSSASTTVSTLSGTDYYRFDVEITGGAEKTASATAACKPNAAASLGTSKTAVWAVAGVLGVSAVLSIL